MLDLGHVSPPVAAAPPSEARPLGWEYDEPATEVPPATVPPSAPSSTVCSTCPPSTPDRLPGDVTP
jgi:hypothetical protein